MGVERPPVEERLSVLEEGLRAQYEAAKRALAELDERLRRVEESTGAGR